MAYCPYCGNEVSYFGRTAKGTSTILKNLFRGDDTLYTCKSCNRNYRTLLGSRLLPGLFAFCSLGFILHLIDKIPALIFIYDHIVIFMIAFFIIGIIGDYIWWRYFAQLETED